VNRVIYQHPLAYLLGLEGLALLRALSGVYGRDFTIDRFREIRALLDSAAELGDGVEARPIATREGYARWAASYDEPGNELIDIEEPIVREAPGRYRARCRLRHRSSRRIPGLAWPRRDRRRHLA
jgi:hypothetical protein